MHRVVLAVLATAFAACVLQSAAQAAEPTSPAGSTFDGQDVKCGHTHTFIDAPGVIRNDWSGAEVCADGDASVLQFRVIVKSNNQKQGPIYTPEYVHVDGDKDNPAGQGHVAHLNLFQP